MRGIQLNVSPFLFCPFLAPYGDYILKVDNLYIQAKKVH
jgi:hypothetical protein